MRADYFNLARPKETGPSRFVMPIGRNWDKGLWGKNINLMPQKSKLVSNDMFYQNLINFVEI